MATITASEVNKLRQQTGAGMMDCKKALVEAEGDFDKAIDILRKKGQKVAAKRADREATEGAVLATTNDANSAGVILALNCETDFVAKNDGFVALANEFLSVAIKEQPENLEALLSCQIDGMSISDKLTEQTGVIGEKLEISAYHKIEAPYVTFYIHSNNKLASIVGLDQEAPEAGKDVAMQIAAMNPLGLTSDEISQEVIDRELEVARDLARQEGKPEAMLDKIAQGRLNKFFKENTLLDQAFIKEGKKSVKQYLKENGDLNVTSFKRVGLGV